MSHSWRHSYMNLGQGFEQVPWASCSMICTPPKQEHVPVGIVPAVSLSVLQQLHGHENASRRLRDSQNHSQTAECSTYKCSGIGMALTTDLKKLLTDCSDNKCTDAQCCEAVTEVAKNLKHHEQNAAKQPQ